MRFKSSQHRLQNRRKSTIVSESIKHAANNAPFDSRMTKVVDLAEPAQHAKGKKSGLAYLAIAGLVALFPTYTNAGEPPELLKYNRSFAIDSCQESIAKNGDKILKDCNFFVRNYADAVLEIYDKNNQLVTFQVLEGARPSTSIVEQVFVGSIYFIVTTVTLGNNSEYSFGDFRRQGGTMSDSNQTTVGKIVIPKGGKMVVTQSSEKAMIVNYTAIALSLFDKIADITASSLADYLRLDEVNAAMAKNYSRLYLQIKESPVEEDSNTVINMIILTTVDVIIDVMTNTDLPKDSWNQIKGSFQAASKTLKSSLMAAEAAEAFALGLNITGQMTDLNRAVDSKGTKADTDLVIENKIDTPLLKPIYRFADIDGVSTAYLVLLEKEAKLSFLAQNYAQFDEPEVFGVNDPLDRDEFLTSLRHLMKVNGHNVFASMDSYKAALKTKNAKVDYTSNPVNYAQAYDLIDTALLLGFDTYKFCTSVGGLSNRVAIAKHIQIIKSEQGFTSASSQAAKNLFISSIIESNKEAPKIPMTRRQSLALYYGLDQAIKRGNAKCPISH